MVRYYANLRDSWKFLPLSVLGQQPFPLLHCGCWSWVLFFSRPAFNILGLLRCRFWFLTSCCHFILKVPKFGFQSVMRMASLSRRHNWRTPPITGLLGARVIMERMLNRFITHTLFDSLIWTLLFLDCQKKKSKCLHDIFYEEINKIEGLFGRVNMVLETML